MDGVYIQPNKQRKVKSTHYFYDNTACLHNGIYEKRGRNEVKGPTVVNYNLTETFQMICFLLAKTKKKERPCVGPVRSAHKHIHKLTCSICSTQTYYISTYEFYIGMFLLQK